MQSQPLQFETPENIVLQYEVAGLGTRFVAWFTDQLLMFILMVVIVIALLIVGALSGSALEQLGDLVELNEQGQPQLEDAPLYLFGLILLAIGFFSFLYYGVQELCFRGQTIGKRSVSLGVAKLDGFTLDPGSVLLRNLFRVIDHLPPLWIVPLVSKRGQRLGDMVAGTVVVVHRKPKRDDLREEILRRGQTDRMFRWDPVRLRRLQPADLLVAEQIYRRANQMSPADAEPILVIACKALAQKMADEAPPDGTELRYLEELLAHEYQRQSRKMG